MTIFTSKFVYSKLLGREGILLKRYIIKTRETVHKERYSDRKKERAREIDLKGTIKHAL